MQQSLSLTNLGSTILNLLRRYHVVTFTVIAVGGVAAALYLLNATFIAASTPTESPTEMISIDQATLEKINKMHTRAQLTSPDDARYAMPTPSDRINPLVTR